jgi:SAM-dependent methyltransferase
VGRRPEPPLRRQPLTEAEQGAARRRRGGEDPELVAGSVAHYEDPAYYDQTYRDRRDDVAYYVALAQRLGRGGVLEYGCGSGRITLPIARAGLSIVGIDLSAPMLAELRKRLRSEDSAVRTRVSTRRGDMRSASIDRRFSLVICPFNALLHLYKRRDVERFLERVRRHLTPRGELCFDVSIPDPEELCRKPDRPHFAPRFRYPGAGVVRYSERFDYDALQQVLFVSMEFMPKDGSSSWMTPLAHRQFFPQELEALLHYNGFRIHRVVGDFDGEPTTETSTLVYHCRRRLQTTGFRLQP